MAASAPKVTWRLFPTTVAVVGIFTLVPSTNTTSKFVKLKSSSPGAGEILIVSPALALDWFFNMALTGIDALVRFLRPTAPVLNTIGEVEASEIVAVPSISKLPE